jgi:hypothetical protein
MFRRLYHNPTFRRAILSACAIVGVLGISSGIFQVVHGHIDGAAGIIGGAIAGSIGLLGLRTAMRPTLHNP